MYCKPAMTCFKYQVYLYGLEAITYLSAILWVVTEPLLRVIRLPPTPPLQANFETNTYTVNRICGSGTKIYDFYICIRINEI